MQIGLNKVMLGLVATALFSSVCNAAWMEIPGFKAYAAKQKTYVWCWAASLQMALSSQGANVSQEEIVQQVMGAITVSAASTEQITQFLLSGWRFSSTAGTYTLDTLTFPSAPPGPMVQRYMEIGRPVIIGYRSGPQSQHAVVVFGGDFQMSPNRLLKS